MDLGTTISRLRAQQGLSQGDLAEALDVSRQSVSKWETNASIPDLDKLIRLSRFFGISLDELVTGESTPEKSSSASISVDFWQACFWRCRSGSVLRSVPAPKNGPVCFVPGLFTSPWSYISAGPPASVGQ